MYEVTARLGETIPENEYYENQFNLKRFGERKLTGEIAIEVMAEISHVLTLEQVDNLSPLALKWIEYHAALAKGD